MSRLLPVRPSLTHLRNEAKAILRAHRDENAACCRVLRNLKPFAKASDEEILAASVSLADVQHALAADYGYPTWALLKQRVERTAPPIRLSPSPRWYHGSPHELQSLRAGSTVTPILELAEAFAHRPDRVNINIRENDQEPSRTIIIEHNGRQAGFVYEVHVDDPSADLRPHPESTMAPGEEMIGTRDLPLSLLTAVAAEDPPHAEFSDVPARPEGDPPSDLDPDRIRTVNWAAEVLEPMRMRHTQLVHRVLVTPGGPRSWDASSVAELRDGDFVAGKWGRQIQDLRESPRAELCDALVAADGVVLEVGVGPGGGFMPGVLDRCPDARIIVNDLSPAVLTLWADFFRRDNLARNAVFIAFDRAAMPLRDASVAGIGSALGLGDERGLAEAYRVLRPGGVLVSWEMRVDPTDWAKLPIEFRQRWQRTSPFFAEGLEPHARRAGFAIAWVRVLPGRALRPDDGGLPGEANRHGVTLKVDYEYLLAHKPDA